MTYAVCVTLQVTPDDLEEFMPLMLENARASLTDEKGCQRFDILTDPDREGEVFLFELYEDRAAFDAHRETKHYKSFDAATVYMIRAKKIRTYAQVIA